MRKRDNPPDGRVDQRTNVQYTPGDGAALTPPTRRPATDGAASGDGLTLEGAETMSRVQYAAPETVRARVQFPLFIHEEHVFRHPRTGELVYCHLVWGSRRRWLRWAARHSSIAPTWHVTPIGPFVVAFGVRT